MPTSSLGGMSSLPDYIRKSLGSGPPVKPGWGTLLKAWSGGYSHTPPVTSNASRGAQQTIAGNRAAGQSSIPGMNLSSLGQAGNQAMGQSSIPGMNVAQLGTPWSPGAGTVGQIGQGGGGMGGGGGIPAPAPTATEQAKRDGAGGGLGGMDDAALAREVFDLIALEFGPREKENQRALEDLLGIRGREEDYYNQFMGTGTQAIGNIYDLVYGKQKGLQGELNQRLADSRGYEEGLGDKLFAGAPGSTQSADILGQLSSSLGSESVANQMLESLSQQHFLNQLTGTTREQAQSAEDFRLQQGSELAQLRETMLGEELGLRHKGRDITEEKGLTTRQLTRELEREMYERDRQEMLDELDAEIRRGQLGVDRDRLGLERESLQQQGQGDWLDYLLGQGNLELNEQELQENARQFNLSHELEREKHLASQLGDPNIATRVNSQFPGNANTPIRTATLDLINGKWGYGNFEASFSKAVRSAQVIYEATTGKKFTPEMQAVMREIALSNFPEAGSAPTMQNQMGGMSQWEYDKATMDPVTWQDTYGYPKPTGYSSGTPAGAGGTSPSSKPDDSFWNNFFQGLKASQGLWWA